MNFGPGFDFNDHPFLVVWEMTRACALVCRHCRASAKVHRHPQELDGDEAFRFLDQVVRAKPGIFILTGGDPIQRPDLYDIVGYASGKGLRVALSPSATPQFLKADLKRLKDLGCMRISISMDGATRETHDKFRGVQGTWDYSMQALQNVREAGIEVQINSTLTRQNLGEFDGFVKLLDEIKPVLWSVFQLVPTGRGKSADMLNAYEMEELFVKLAHLSAKVPYDIKTTEGHHFRRVILQQLHDEKALQKRAPIGINDGKGFVFVSHIGEIQPSGFLPLTGGNVRKDELIEVYRNSEIFRNLRNSNLLKGKCGVCEYRDICGGSRARSYALTGDYLGEEPLCAYVSPNYHPTAVTA
ncbi:MAG: radical SAM protein [Desulfobacterales bacterium]|nr:radical SAM protein [Desulfobacterales bacterium]